MKTLHNNILDCLADGATYEVNFVSSAIIGPRPREKDKYDFYGSLSDLIGQNKVLFQDFEYSCCISMV